ncbi:MAG: hypothetical protein K0V04_35020 [Deltaproteobacteria bacterium]|nr:hypothetical protein [Deltaproteobacteria bacterium]
MDPPPKVARCRLDIDEGSHVYRGLMGPETPARHGGQHGDNDMSLGVEDGTWVARSIVSGATIGHRGG